MACMDRSTTLGSRCIDSGLERTVASVSARGILSPLPGHLARDDRPCDYDIRHNLNAQYVGQLPVRVRNHSRGYALNRWQISGTAFWHSGVPFSVLSTPYVKRITMTRSPSENCFLKADFSSREPNREHSPSEFSP